MASKGTYLGGSTIISFNKKNREEGWEPDKVVLSKSKLTPKEREDLKQSEKLRQKQTRKKSLLIRNFEKSFVKYAKRCAISEMDGESWPKCPRKILNYFQLDESRIRKEVSQHPIYIQVIKDEKSGKR